MKRLLISAPVCAALFASLLLLLGALSSCGDGVGTGSLRGRTFALTQWNEHTLSVEKGQVLETYAAGLGPVLVAPFPIVRLGLRWDAASTIVLEARFAVRGGSLGPWVPVTTTWREGPMYVGHVDTGDQEVVQAQVRFLGRVIPSYLYVEALDRVGEAALTNRLTPDSSATPREQTLTAIGAGSGSGSRRSYLSAPWVSRSSWGAQAPRCSPSDRSKYRITVHHTVTPNNDTMDYKARMRQIQSYHRNTRGYCDIGYHVVIAQNGSSLEGRTLSHLGAHASNANSGNAGISFMGNYDVAKAPAKMECAAAKVIDYIARKYGISRSRSTVKGHRELGSTACPGRYLYPRLSALISQSTSGCGTSPPPGCSSDSDCPSGQICQSRKCVNKPPPTKTGTLIGVIYVHPDTAKRIAGATVKLNNGKSVVASSSGVYEFTLPVGTYTATASKSGYSSASVTRAVTAGAKIWGSIGLKKASTPPPDKTPPVVIFTSPGADASVSKPTVTVKGKATDNKGVKSFAILGKAVPLDGSGNFSTSVGLREGRNKITAEARDAAGNAGSATLYVSYVPVRQEPPPAYEPPPVHEPPPAHESTPDAGQPDRAGPDRAVQPEPAVAPPDGASVTDLGGSGTTKSDCVHDGHCGSGQKCDKGRCMAIDNEPKKGCGCSSPTDRLEDELPGLLLVGLGLLLVGIRRRRG